MIHKEDIKKVLTQLEQSEIAKIEMGGFVVALKIFNNGHQVSLSTAVYFGGNYIPHSVRNCLKKRAPFETFGINTSFLIDEENFRIFLKHQEWVEDISENQFMEILKSFVYVAGKWREHFDERDRNDLVYIPVK